MIKTNDHNRTNTGGKRSLRFDCTLKELKAILSGEQTKNVNNDWTMSNTGDRTNSEDDQMEAQPDLLFLVVKLLRCKLFGFHCLVSMWCSG